MLAWQESVQPPAVVERAEPVAIAEERHAPAPAPAPVVAAPRPEAPRLDRQEVLATAGLQMVETRGGSAPPPVEEDMKLGRPRKQRSATAEEPLVQVETRK